ncbi:MAG: DUF4286 family protein [Flavobacteriia bacterium]|jgi:hypothetical protein|nr:DUF4286 family protein [Flavobacteriia bacterium]
MILYNITVSIDLSKAEEWLLWMRTKHIPDVMATSCFIEGKISKIQTEEADGITYSVMYICASEDLMKKYSEQHAPLLQKEHSEKFQGYFAAFRTLLTVIEEFK